MNYERTLKEDYQDWKYDFEKELYGELFELSEFPGCCGFAVLVGFIWNSLPNKFIEFYKEDLINTIEEAKRDKITGIFVTLTKQQQKLNDPILLSIGFELFLDKATSLKTGNKLFAYYLPLVK